MKKTLIATMIGLCLSVNTVKAAIDADPMPNPVYVAPSDADIQALSQILSDLTVARAKDDAKIAEYTQLSIDEIRDTAQEQSLDKHVQSGTQVRQQEIRKAAATNPTMNIQAALQQTINGFQSGLLGAYLNASTISKLRELQNNAATNGVAGSAADKAQWLLNESGSTLSPEENESVASIEETLADVNRLMTDASMSEGGLQQLELTRQDLLKQLEVAKKLETPVATPETDKPTVVSGTVETPSDEELLAQQIKRLAEVEKDIQKFALKGGNLTQAESVAMQILITQRAEIEASIKELNARLNSTETKTDGTGSTTETQHNQTTNTESETPTSTEKKGISLY